MSQFSNMELSSERVAYLINKHLENDLSFEEGLELENWKQSPDNQKLFENLTSPAYLRRGLKKMASYNKEAAFEKLQAGLHKKPATVRSIGRKMLAAAVIAGVIATGIIIYLQQQRTNSEAQAVVSTIDPNQIKPGGNRAILTLADGRTITLDDTPLGLLGQQGNTSIVKQDGAEVVYKAEDDKPQQARINTIETPRGGQYSLVLEDGSKVTLNAASKLEFPSSFDGAATREVVLSGEAFFEVSKDKSKPFYVHVKDMDVVVKGTAFNVKSYDDSREKRTTLFEGAVAINGRRMIRHNDSTVSFDLAPGEESRYDEVTQTVKIVKNVDLEAASSWRRGLLNFDNTDVMTLLSEIGRWYDIDIIYSKDIPKGRFEGQLPRSLDFAELLQVLNEGGIRTKVEGRKLIIL